MGLRHHIIPRSLSYSLQGKIGKQVDRRQGCSIGQTKENLFKAYNGLEFEVGD